MGELVETFGARLERVFATAGRLCVGIDPHASLLASWDLPDSAAGTREFGLRVVDAAVGRVGILKPQVAFFERHGSAGYAALEAVLSAAREAGLLVIADAKRGDLGTSVDAYGEAWLTPGSPLEADAMTTVAYQGLGSLAGVLDRAAASGKGVFVLAATSNPEAALTQKAVRADRRSVADGVIADIRGWVSTRSTTVISAAEPAATSTRTSAVLSDIGVVLGATIDTAAFGIAPEDLVGIPILAPGFGAQGAVIGDVARLFGAAASHTLVAVSRSVLAAGLDGLADAINQAAAEVTG
ncbi:orotidine-5'-phosphate decarboxylase [soil metagenome]